MLGIVFTLILLYMFIGVALMITVIYLVKRSVDDDSLECIRDDEFIDCVRMLESQSLQKQLLVITIIAIIWLPLLFMDIEK